MQYSICLMSAMYVVKDMKAQLIYKDLQMSLNSIPLVKTPTSNYKCKLCDKIKLNYQGQSTLD